MNRPHLIPFPIRALVLGLTLTFSTLCAHAQTITQIIDATGDGSNPLDSPLWVAVDATGNAYVTGLFSKNAFKITPAGVITEIIDATGDGSNALVYPEQIAVDAAGNVYVVEGADDKVFKITPGGAITEIIDASGDGSNPLDGPYGVAVDAAGNVYVTGLTSDNAFKITPGGAITEIIDASGDGSHPLDNPVGVAVDAAGNVYVTGHDTDNAFKITPGGVVTEIIDTSGDGLGHTLIYPYGVAADPAGNVYVAGNFTWNVFKIAPGGAVTQIIDATGDGTNPLTAPVGVAVDATGNVYVTGSDNNAFKITPGGAITEIIDASGDGSNPLSGILGVAVDATGNVYVPGHVSDNVFKIAFDTDGDGDGVLDADDLCPGTVIPEATVPSKKLGKNHFALVDSDFEFDTVAPHGHGPNRSYNTAETGGCSCEQILSEMGLDGDAGLTRFGCDVSTMDAWVAYVGSLGKGVTSAPGMAASEELPQAFALEGNYPNPFNPSTTLRFDVPEEAHVLLVVYDVTGREVARLLDQTVEAGVHEVRWDASSAPSGTYFYRLTAGAFSETKVMTLLK